MLKFLMITAASTLVANLAFAAMSDRPTQLPASAEPRNQQTITAQLQALGYSGLSDVRLSGDIYTANALWRGKSVSLHLDSKLGRIDNLHSPEVETINTTSDMSESDFVTSLAANGYHSIHDIVKNGQVLRATASRNGSTYNLRVNSDTGVVTTHDDRTGMTIGQADDLDSVGIESALTSAGYEKPEFVARHGGMIAAKAWRNGEQIHLRIDSSSGIVRVQN